MGRSWNKTRTMNDRSRAENYLKSSQNSFQKGPQETQNRSQHPPRAPSMEGKTHGGPKLAKKSRKSAESRSKVASPGPKWDPKIDKKTTRSEKSAPKMAPEAVFSDFLDCRRSESFPDRFWEGLNLENHAPTTAGARFSQNHGFHVFLEF